MCWLYRIHINDEVILGRSTITDNFVQEGPTINLYKSMLVHYSSILSIGLCISNVIKIRHLITFSAAIIVGLAFKFSVKIFFSSMCPN